MLGAATACTHPAPRAFHNSRQGFFDGILMHSYLEHETEVLPVLKGAYRCLKQDGKLYIRVPNFASVNRRVMGATGAVFAIPTMSTTLHPGRSVLSCQSPVST